MPKTKELTIFCDEATIKADYSRGIKVIIYEPLMDKLLSEIDFDDILEHVRSEVMNKPEEVFEAEYLEKWAEENGYTKE